MRHSLMALHRQLLPAAALALAVVAPAGIAADWKLEKALESQLKELRDAK